MHHALSIREVLDTILSQCAWRTLANLAQTSRHFHQPCVAQLWKHVTEAHLIPLDNMFDRPLVEGVLPNKKVKNSVQDIWSRFQSFCALVRTVSLRLHRAQQDAGPLFLRMAVLRPDGLHFPRLKSLHFRATYDDELSALMLFVGSPLEKIDIDLHLESRVDGGGGGPDIENFLVEERARDIFMATLLHRLSTATAHFLKEFSLCGFYGDRKSACYLEALSSFVTCTPGLKKFGADFYALSPELVRALASLPELEEWTIEHRAYREFFIEDLDANDDIPIALSMINKDSFPKLRSLAFGGEPSMAPALLQSLPSVLNRMCFEFGTFNRLSAHFFSELAEAIQARSAPTSLSLELTIRQLRRDFDPDADPNPFSFDIVSSLLQCTSVDLFKMVFVPNGSIPFDFQNSHLAAISHAWPRLKTLVIEWNTGSLHSDVAWTGLLEKPNLNLDGIVSLARCPDLATVLLSELDTTTVPSAPPAQCASLRLLKFGDELVRNVDGVARFLFEAFPEVQLVDGFRGMMYKRDHGTWGLVHLELAKLRGQKPIHRALVGSRLTPYDVHHITTLDDLQDLSE